MTQRGRGTLPSKARHDDISMLPYSESEGTWNDNGKMVQTTKPKAFC